MGRLSSKERKKRKRLDELNQADAPREDAAPEAADPPVEQVRLVTAARQECLCMPRERN